MRYEAAYSEGTIEKAENRLRVLATVFATAMLVVALTTVFWARRADGRSLPTVSMASAGAEVTESSRRFEVPVVLDMKSAQEIVVSYSVSGKATYLLDHDLRSGKLVIPPGTGSASLAIDLIDDRQHEDEEDLIITLTGAWGAQLGSSTTFTLLIQDDDPFPGVSLHASSSRLPESDGQVDLIARLSEPSGEDAAVLIAFSGSASSGTDYVTPQTMLFIPAGETEASTTVFAIDNSRIDGSRTLDVEILVAVNAEPTLGTIGAITLADDDHAGYQVYPGADLIVAERVGSTHSAPVTIALTAEPSGDVTVEVNVSDSYVAEVWPHFVTFTPETWNLPQSVTVTAFDDTESGGSASFVVLFGPVESTDANFATLDPSGVTATRVEDEFPGITVTGTGGLLAGPTGAGASFSIVLQQAPTSDVTIPLYTKGGGFDVEPKSLTFTPENFWSPRTVQVVALDKSKVRDAQSVWIGTGAAESEDPVYSGMATPGVEITFAAAGVLAVAAAPQSGLLTDTNGRSATFSVVLDAAPTDEVVIDLASSDTADGTVSPSRISFTPQSWSQPQTVTVRGQYDPTASGDRTYTIVTAATSSLDPNFDGLAVPDISVVNLNVVNK